LIWFLFALRNRKILNKLLIKGLAYVFIVFFMLLISILVWFDYNKIDTQTINDWAEFKLISNTCEFEYAGSYRYLDLYDWDFQTPTQKPNVDQYTKSISISWNIEDVKICILADVRPDHKVEGYSFTVKAYLWSQNHAWYLNVWRYKPTNQFFDKDSGWSNGDLYGRFNGNETPFKQVIDLERVIIADVWWEEYYKYIRPIVNFQKTWILNVWAYVEWDNHRYAWNIVAFRIIYKWEGEILKAK
jgi:hypothetical protein